MSSLVSRSGRQYGTVAAKTQTDLKELIRQHEDTGWQCMPGAFDYRMEGEHIYAQPMFYQRQVKEVKRSWLSEVWNFFFREKS